jgi:isopentenyl phosphate kinase
LNQVFALSNHLVVFISFLRLTQRSTMATMNPMKSRQSSTPHLCFVKFGGSLITDKAKPRTPRKDVIARLAGEIRLAEDQIKGLRLLLGHGSGSFGHVPAKIHGTRKGVESRADWKGFAEVWFDASSLNRLVIEALHKVDLPAVSFPISAAVTTKDGQVSDWNLGPIDSALNAGLLPVVYGDVVFDTLKGGTILSTEDIFTNLARRFKPRRILLSGIDEFVWADYPLCKHPIREITTENWQEVSQVLGGSSTVDVTGGMATKVHTMIALTAEIPGLSVRIFSGDHPGNLVAVLEGRSLGTRISQSS